jgi:hypothetical protein
LQAWMAAGPTLAETSSVAAGEPLSIDLKRARRGG